MLAQNYLLGLQGRFYCMEVEVCLSPALYPMYHHSEKTVIIIDVLRATTSICAAFSAGVEKILPVSGIDDARKAKQMGYIVAAERDGKVLDFADFGNSPDVFTPERVGGKVIAYSTTNGTQAIAMVASVRNVLIGAFSNLSALSRYLIQHPQPVLLLCSGWKNKFNLEDTLCAGAIAEQILQSAAYTTSCDSTHAAIDLWQLAKNNLIKYLEKASHRQRLKTIVDEKIIHYCLQIDTTDVIPRVYNGFIEKA